MIEEVLKYIRQTSAGKQQNVFMTGDRGIGKSSLASFLRHYASNHEGLLGVHVFLGGVSTLDELVRRVFDQLLKITKRESWFGKIAHFFGDNVEEIGLFGVSVRFSPQREDLGDLVRSFPEALANLCGKMKGVRKGLLVVLDDINGLAEQRNSPIGTRALSTRWPQFIRAISLLC